MPGCVDMGTDLVAFNECLIFAIFTDFGNKQSASVLCGHGFEHRLGAAVAEHEHARQTVLVSLWQSDLEACARGKIRW